MTRIIPARLLKVGPMAAAVAVAVLSLVLAACGSSSTASSRPAAQASGASAPAVHGAAASTLPAKAAAKTVSAYGSAPDPSLPKVCLISAAEMDTLLGMTDVSARLGNVNRQACVYAGQRDWSSSSQNLSGPNANILQVDGYDTSALSNVSIPKGAPFDWASVRLDHGEALAVAHLSGTSRSVMLGIWKPHTSNHGLLKLGAHGLQNIMYWWSHSHSPASASGSQSTAVPTPSGTSAVLAPPNTPSCQLLAKIRAAGMLLGTIGEWDASTDPETNSSLCNIFIRHDGRVMDEGLEILRGTDAQSALENRPSGTVVGGGLGARLYVEGTEGTDTVISLKVDPDQLAEAQRAMNYAMAAYSS